MFSEIAPSDWRKSSARDSTVSHQQPKLLAVRERGPVSNELGGSGQHVTTSTPFLRKIWLLCIKVFSSGNSSSRFVWSLFLRKRTQERFLIYPIAVITAAGLRTAINTYFLLLIPILDRFPSSSGITSTGITSNRGLPGGMIWGIWVSNHHELLKPMLLYLAINS